MADSDKDILITPNTSQTADPSIVFSSGATGGDDITLAVTDDGTITTLSWSGSAGELFSISNDLTGIIFAVNDASGIPSLEVNADGTVSMAEFDGEVGIGTSAPLHQLHIEGRDVAASHTGIFIDSRGDAYLDLRADNTTGGAETNNPYIRFRQDQDAVETVLGHNNTGDDALGNAVTGAGSNEFVIHNRFATGTISLAVNGSVGLTVDDNDRVYIGQDTTGYLEAVTGNYGSVQVAGAEGSSGTWHGYSIGGRFVFMDNAGSATTNRGGIYDDTNNEWLIQFNTTAAGNNETTLYYNNTQKLNTTSAGVSVTGTMAATTVTGANVTSGSNPGHTHTFDNLTSKTSGTGDYSTTGNLTSGRASGGAALTINDGQGNANLTFNHEDGSAEQAGNVGRITVNTDSTTGAQMDFDITSNAAAGAVTSVTYMSLTESGLSVTGDVSGTTIGGITEANLLDKTATETVSGAYTFSNAGNTLTGQLSLSTTGDITATDNSNTGISAGYLGIASTSATDGHGLSLYGGASDGQPTYGMMFAGVSTYGTFGPVTGGTWATYFTMNNTAGRGWIWRDVSTPANIAGLSNTGDFEIAGNLTLGDSQNLYFGDSTDITMKWNGSDFFATGTTGGSAAFGNMDNFIVYNQGVCYVPDAGFNTDNIHFYPVVRGGGFNSNNAAETGYCIIQFPSGSLSWNCMLSMEIHGYDYSAGEIGGWGINVSGYTQASANWANENVEILYGEPPFTQVLLGEGTSYKYVLLGTSTTDWDYPQIMVRNVQRGYANQFATGETWAISISASTPAGWVQDSSFDIRTLRMDRHFEDNKGTSYGATAAAPDGRLYSNGTDVYLDMANGVDFRIRGGASGTESMITALDDSAVQLYHNGSIKLQTASDGIDVTGDVGGTSIGGITQANLVDKSATETITGTWTLDGAVTTADYGTGGRVKDGSDIARPIGFNVMPVISFSSTLTPNLANNGGCYYHSSATAHTVNVNNDANIPTGATYMFRNWYQPTSTTVANGGTLTFNPGVGVYLWWASGDGVPTGGTGNRTLAGGGFCTLYKQSDTIWHMWGSGIS